MYTLRKKPFLTKKSKKSIANSAGSHQKIMSSKEEDEIRPQLSVPDRFLLRLGLQNDHRKEETMRRREAKWYKLTGETPSMSIEKSMSQSFCNNRNKKRRKLSKFRYEG